MCKLKPFIAVLMLVFVLSLAAPASYAGDIQLPGITGTQETPGITADDPPGGGGGEVQLTEEIPYPGIRYVLAVLFGIS
jgi:hypothetical protein